VDSGHHLSQVTAYYPCAQTGRIFRRRAVPNTILHAYWRKDTNHSYAVRVARLVGNHRAFCTRARKAALVHDWYNVCALA
jgi:hypothetical protein